MNPLLLDGPVLVVDDDHSLATFLKDYLEALGVEVFCSTDGQDAVNRFRKISPAFVILDVMMPFMDGYDACFEIRKMSRVPILMLTAKIEEEDKLHGLNIGADDYLTKPFSPRELVARMQAIMRRYLDESSVSKQLYCSGLLYDKDRHLLFWKREPIHLTFQETQIAVNLLERKGKVCTREQLLNCLYPTRERNVVDRIIDVHIGNIRQKIREVDSTFDLIKTIRGIGYCLEVPNENQAFI